MNAIFLHARDRLIKHRNLTVLLAIFCFWFLILLSSGTLFSGFHFMDDHDFVAIHYSLTTKKLGFLEVIIQWLQDDHQTGRFRPFYFVNRIFQTQFLGINVPLWSIYTGLQAVLTTYFFFIFATLIELTFTEAILFTAITTIGAQSAVWWMLGPSETIGTFLFSICLVFVALSAISTKHRSLYTGLMIVYALLMSLCKESYVLVLPAIALMVVWLRQRTLHSWGQTIRQIVLPCAALLLIFVIELGFIKYFVGTTPDIGYAGFEGFSPTAIWQSFRSLSLAGEGWVIIISLLILPVSIYLQNQLKWNDPVAWKQGLDAFKPLLFPGIIFVVIALPQVLLYAKSGISQRYIFPGILAFSLLTICIYHQLNHRRFKLLILSLIALSLSIKLSSVWSSARIFALEGYSTNQLLSTIIAKTRPNDPILLVTNPFVYYEWNYSIKKYLNYVGERNQLYVHSFQDWNKNKSGRDLRSFYNNLTLETLPDKSQFQCVIVFPLLNDAFLGESAAWFERSQYQEYVFGNFNRNLNPNSEINLYCRNPALNARG